VGETWYLSLKIKRPKCPNAFSNRNEFYLIKFRRIFKQIRKLIHTALGIRKYSTLSSTTIQDTPSGLFCPNKKKYVLIILKCILGKWGGGSGLYASGSG
jgi:hypothetical protein